MSRHQMTFPRPAGAADSVHSADMGLRARRAGLVAAALVCATWLTGPAAAQSPAARGFFWKVERAGRVSWLVGSLHMLTADAYPLPPAMTAAFDTSDVLVEEADPDELASPAFAATVMSRALYLDGQTLEDHVSAETFKVIADRGAAAGLPVEVLRRMKPWMVATTLEALALQRGGFDPALGLDVHFFNLATARGRRFSPLETGAEQIGFLEKLGEGVEDALIRENLRSADAEVAQVREIAAAWRAGDAGALERIVLGELRETPGVYDQLIAARNRAWLPKLRTCIETASCFIVVGAGHLVGPEGLVPALRAQGFTVTQQ